MILNNRSVFFMDFLDLCSHHLFIHLQCCLKQLFRLPPEQDHFIPRFALNRIRQLPADFFIWNKGSLPGLIISQISKMNHISKYIILTLNIYRIISKSCRIDLHFTTRNHLNDCCFQTIIIHIDERHNSIIRSCL